MKNTVNSSLIAVLILCTAGCAHPRTIASPVCTKAADPSPSMLAPAPEPKLFSRCLREILSLADQGMPMSDICSTFLREEPMK